MGAFLAGPVGSAVRVFLGLLLGSLVAVLQAGDIASLGDLDWWQTAISAALAVALPLIIAAINPADTRWGKGSVTG